MHNLIRSCLSAFVVAFLCSGCAEMLVTTLHNQNVQKRAQAVQIRANNDGAAILFDILNMEGYFGAWQEHPWAMGSATLADLGTGIATGVAISKSQKSSSSGPAVPAVNLTIDSRGGPGGEGGSGGASTVNVTIGNGNGNTRAP